MALGNQQPEPPTWLALVALASVVAIVGGLVTMCNSGGSTPSTPSAKASAHLMCDAVRTTATELSAGWATRCTVDVGQNVINVIVPMSRA